MKELKNKSKESENFTNQNNFKKRGRDFFSILRHYMKRHPFATFWLFVLAIISSISIISSSLIIQNIMTNLMAPSTIENLILEPDNSSTWSSLTGLVTSEEINQLFSAAEVGFFWMGGDINIPQDISNISEILDFWIDKLSADSTLFATQIFGLKLNWLHWIYVQLGLFIFSGAAAYGSNILSGVMGKNIEIELRNKTLTKLLHQDMSYYSDKKIGEILTKIISDTQIIGDQSQNIPISMITALFTFFGSLTLMFFIDVILTSIVLGLTVLILVSIFATFGIMRKLTFRVRKVITEINGVVTDRIASVKLIKSSGTENDEKKLFAEVHKNYYKKSLTAIKTQASLITVFVTGISSIQIVLVVVAALIYRDNPTYLAVTLPAFVSGVGIMISPISQLTRIIIELVQASTSAVRINEIIQSSPKFNSHYASGDGIYIDNISKKIIFENVEFIYPEKPKKIILPKFNFIFEHGKSYAFVGETGSGKSTIAKLLLRFYDPSQGRILINGTTDLKDVHLASYLDKVGCVEQEPQILFGTVLENIKYGRFNATDEEAIEVAKKAELHDLIMSWPDGYNTILGERGFMLSGGQKQRLVIARMILKDPQLLILDEATSALDNIVEAEIQLQLNKLMQGRTTISIAHRLSTIKNCDQIIVLAQGKGIVQMGTFNELKNKKGPFKKLYEAGLME